MTNVGPLVATWAESLLGQGHFSRLRVIEQALEDHGARLLPLHAGAELGDTQPGLPSIRAKNGGFALVDASGAKPDNALWQARKQWFETRIGTLRVDVLLIEFWPFGRRAFSAEIEWLIAWLRGRNPACRVMTSVRDVLVTKGHFARYAEMVAKADQHLDGVLVHGAPALIPFTRSFPHQLSHVRHTGYIGRSTPKSEAMGERRGVLVTAGGGAVGATLLTTALAARKAGIADHVPWTLIAGMRADPDELAKLRGEADSLAGVEILRHVDDLPDRMAKAELLISQAGYNSVVEMLQAGVPGLLVPYEDPGQDEQLQRAAVLASCNLAMTVRQARFGINAIAQAWACRTNLATSRHGIDLNGAEKTASALLQGAE